MTVLTQDQLKERFKLSREKKEKEKREKQEQKQLQYKELCHKADELLKKAQEEEKIKKIEQLQALAPKKPQKPSNEATEPLKIYHSNLVERYPSERDLYTTREELMAAEERGEGKINWEKFDQLVNETRKQLHYSDIKRKYTFNAEDDWGCYDKNGEYHRGHLDKNGYTLHNWYCVDNKQHQLLEHRMKWEYFNGEIPDDVEVDHITPISEGGTNKLSNLRLCTHRENMNNSNSVRKMSEIKKGKPMPKQARMALDKVLSKKVIRQLENGLTEEYNSAKEAAEKNGLSHSSIAYACRGLYGTTGHLYKNSNWYYI